MARLERYYVADQPLHVIQPGANLQPIFFEGDQRFKDAIANAAKRRAEHRVAPTTTNGN